MASVYFWGVTSIFGWPGIAYYSLVSKFLMQDRDREYNIKQDRDRDKTCSYRDQYFKLFSVKKETKTKTNSCSLFDMKPRLSSISGL